MAGNADERDIWAASLPPRPASVGAARHFTQDALRGLGVAEVEDHATLLVSELATNAVVHAGTRLRVTVRCAAGSVRIEVRDDDPQPVEPVSPDPFDPGGRGILLVDELATNWGVNRNDLGKTVWFELLLR